MTCFSRLPPDCFGVVGVGVSTAVGVYRGASVGVDRVGDISVEQRRSKSVTIFRMTLR